MATTRGLTREEIRTSVGRNVMGSDYWRSTADAGGSTSTLVDGDSFGGDDSRNGDHIIITSGSGDGEITRVSDYTGSSGTHTVKPLITDPSTETYERWKEKFPPSDCHDFINQAINNLVGRVFDPEEDETLHLYSSEFVYTPPSQFKMVNRLERRYEYASALLHDCDTLWGTTDAEVTESLDTQIRRVGNSAYRLEIGTGVDAGDDLATFSISSLDISRYDKIEFWIRSNVAVAVDELNFLLTDAAGTEETLSIGALVADQWAFQSLSVASQESNTAITGGLIDLKADYPAGNAVVLWIDDVRAVRSGSEKWHRIAPHQWRVDKLNGTIRFDDPPDYGLLRISGGDMPSQLTGDADVCEVPEDYVIAFATWMMLLGAPEDDQVYRDRVRYWAGQTVRTRQSISPLPAGTRRLS